jgi:hypothetical protein
MLSWMLVALAAPAGALADATFVLRAHGAAFADLTPAVPVGGNAGTTLGEQRMIALQYAAERWEAALDSDVPVVVDVTFSDQGCAATNTTLAHAAATTAVAGRRGSLLDPERFYPVALANSIVGEDVFPSGADIDAIFNSAIDSGACRDLFGGWYYGLDGLGDSGRDLVQSALHELAHGLGFASFVDPETGVPLEGRIDVFSSHLFDLDLQRSWADMSDAERAGSAANVHRLVWNGEALREALQQRSRVAAPRLTIAPAIAGFSGYVGDTGFAPHSDDGSEHPLVLGVPRDGCRTPDGDITGQVVLFVPGCAQDLVVLRAQLKGAAGVLLGTSSTSLPPLPLGSLTRTATIPVLMLAAQDVALIEAAVAPTTVRLERDPDLGLGVDGSGRALMYASLPVDRGTSISHFDPTARPDRLMEPIATDQVTHDISLAVALLTDLGWNGEGDTLKPTPDAGPSSKPDAAVGDGTHEPDAGGDITTGTIIDGGTNEAFDAGIGAHSAPDAGAAESQPGQDGSTLTPPPASDEIEERDRDPPIAPGYRAAAADGCRASPAERGGLSGFAVLVLGLAGLSRRRLTL